MFFGQLLPPQSVDSRLVVEPHRQFHDCQPTGLPGSWRPMHCEDQKPLSGVICEPEPKMRNAEKDYGLPKGSLSSDCDTFVPKRKQAHVGTDKHWLGPSR